MQCTTTHGNNLALARCITGGINNEVHQQEQHMFLCDVFVCCGTIFCDISVSFSVVLNIFFLTSRGLEISGTEDTEFSIFFSSVAVAAPTDTEQEVLCSYTNEEIVNMPLMFNFSSLRMNTGVIRTEHPSVHSGK